MNTEDVGKLLGLMALHDNRKIGPGDVMGWEDILPADMRFDDARDALRAHRSTSSEWVMPAHIIAGVRQLQRERLQRAGDPPMPGRLTWQQEREWRQNWCDGIKAGMDRDMAAVHASQAMSLPSELPARERRDAIKTFITASARHFTEGQA